MQYLIRTSVKEIANYDLRIRSWHGRLFCTVPLTKEDLKHTNMELYVMSICSYQVSRVFAT
jgi:hypothetical protein